MRETELDRTPLQRIVGFRIAEETYDQLPFTAQIILDLKIEGYTTQEIADVLDMPYTTVYDTFIRARHSLAKSKFKFILETRAYYRDTHRIVVE
jgi:DNA-directed RNA polymerase specialized sigma24 family protein